MNKPTGTQLKRLATAVRNLGNAAPLIPEAPIEKPPTKIALLIRLGRKAS